MRISPQVAEDLQTRSEEAMSQSGINHGHGIPGRQVTESSLSYIAPNPSLPLNEAFCNEVNKVEDHPEYFPRVQGEILSITHTDEDGQKLELQINVHPADNLFFGLVDAMRRAKGEPKIPFSRKVFGPSAHEEEGKDFHASGYGLSCDAIANKGAVLLVGTIVQDAPQGFQAYTDPLVNPVGADTVVPFHQSSAKVILQVVRLVMVSSSMACFLGTTLAPIRGILLQARVWRWDQKQKYPEYNMNTPLQDEQAVRREFTKKCRFDPQGAVLQLLK